jgi:hypothetical protein
MNQKNVDTLIKEFEVLYAQQSDLAFTNLFELFFHLIEQKEVARDVWDHEDIILRPKEKVVNTEDIKNVKMKDLIYFRDNAFKKKVHELFEKLTVPILNRLDENDVNFRLLLDWIAYLSESKVREFRLLASNILGLIVETMLLTARKILLDIRSKRIEEYPDFGLLFLLLQEFYFEKYILKRSKDVDAVIRQHAIDSLIDGFQSLHFWAMDEIQLMLDKGANKKVNPVRNSPFTDQAVCLIMDSLTTGNPERISKFLHAFPIILGKMEADRDQSGVAGWQKASEKIFKGCLQRVDRDKLLIQKMMAHEKEEIGANIVGMYEKGIHSPLFAKAIEQSDIDFVLFMMTSAKRKLKEAALEFAYMIVDQDIDTKDSSKKDEEKRIERFVGIIKTVYKMKFEQSNEKIQVEEIIFLMNNFRPSICRQFKGELLFDLFQGSLKVKDKTDAMYLGSLLHVLLKSMNMVIRDELTGEMKKKDPRLAENTEEIKKVHAQLTTSIRERQMSWLSHKDLSNPEILQVYIKLIKKANEVYSQEIQESLLKLFEQIQDSSTLKKLAKLMRSIVDSMPSNTLFKENISQMYMRLSQTFEHLSKQFTKLVETEGSSSKNIPACVEKIVAQLNKIVPITQMFQLNINAHEAFFEHLRFIIDIFVVDESFKEYELLEISLKAAHLTMVYYLINSGTSMEHEQAYLKYRKDVLQYFLYFIDSRSLKGMNAKKCHGIRRAVFVYIVEILKCISNDESLYLQTAFLTPSEEIINQLWVYIDEYIFKRDVTAQAEERGEYRLNTNEKKLSKGKLDVEGPRQPAITEEGLRTHTKEGGSEKVFFLNFEDHEFKEDVKVLINLFFQLCGACWNTIGVKLAPRMIFRVLNLPAIEQDYLDSMEAFLEVLGNWEEKDKLNKLYVWKLVMNCIKSFDLPTLRKLAKFVFSFFKKYSDPSSLPRTKYTNFCLLVLQWAVEEEEDKERNQKALLFIKINVLGENSTNRLLYLTQNILDKLRRENKEEEVIFTDKYINIVRLRDGMAEICKKQIKEAERLENERIMGSRRKSTSHKPRQSSSKKLDIEEKSAEKGKSKEHKKKNNRSKNPKPQQSEEEPPRGLKTKRPPSPSPDPVPAKRVKKTAK